MRRATLVIFFLGVQLLLPLVQLTSDATARFGWQMFARTGPASAFEVVHADGTTTPFDLDGFAVNARPEIDWRELVHEEACANSGVVAIRYLDASITTQEMPCK